jgi:putative spermidine/putrescine transport system permease protein
MTRTFGERFWSAAAIVMAALVLAFLVLPILAVLPLSVNSGRYLLYPLEGFSWRWYDDLFNSERWSLAIWNSFVIGVSATLIATVLGTLAAIGLAMADFRGKGLLVGILLAPMIVPVIIFAVGLAFFFGPLGLTQSYTGLILAHAALGTPFVLVTVGASLQGFDRNLMRAALSLGAGPVTTFRRVMLPLIGPGVASGALFAFAVSLDEVITILLIGGPQHRTIPREMFSGIREDISPTIAAAAVVMTIVAVFLLLTVELLRGRAEKMGARRS